MTNTIKTAQYRVETGKLYEYSKEQNAYIFAVSLNGRTKKQAIIDYEEMVLFG